MGIGSLASPLGVLTSRIKPFLCDLELFHMYEVTQNPHLELYKLT